MNSLFRRLKFRIQSTMSIPRGNKSEKQVISIIGTTGVGKSQLSIELARRFNGEIINADSMQMYHGLDQITNKHPTEERLGVPHHVMDHVKWEEQYYIHRFKRECENAMKKCWDDGKIPILVGGTHYYLQSVLFDNKTIGSNDEVEVDASKLTKEQKEILNGDSNIIYEKLKEMDPVISQKFHPNDTRRIKRALEVCYVFNEPASSVYGRQRETNESNGTSLKYDTLFFWVYSKLPQLDTRLDSRVDKMMYNGGLTELGELYKFYQKEILVGNETVEKMDSGVWQVIGFKEFLPYLNKHGPDTLIAINSAVDTKERNEAIDKLLMEKEFAQCCDEMKLKTRRYARKQIKWIKNLLGPQLKEEEANGFVKFGKIYVLDATNLSLWNEGVGKRGKQICEEFLRLGYVKQFVDIPDSLNDEKLIIEKSPNKAENWVHHVCEICTDRETGKPLVYVGDQWEIHLKSKKHRHNLNRGKRKREYEEWLKKKNVK